MAKYVSKKFCPYIYSDWAEIFKTMDDRTRSEILMAITCFPDYEPEGVVLWGFFKSQLKVQYENWLDRSETYKNNAKSKKAIGSNSKQLLPVANHCQQQSPIACKQEQELEQEVNINNIYTSNLDDVNAEFQLASQDSETQEPKVEPKENHNEPVPYKEIQGIYNSICVPGCRKCVAMTDARKTLVRTRMADLKSIWGENNIENFRRLFTIVSQSDFLMGRSTPTNGHENFRVGIDWILNNKNMMKIVEGNYSGENEMPSGTFQNAVSSEQIERDRQAHIKALREQMGAFL